METKLSNQTVGNIGLDSGSYQLSRLGWNVMPTTRNARGIDLLIYSQDAPTKLSILVKALSRRNPVPLGKNLDHVFADFFIICGNAVDDHPRCFVLRPGEVRRLVHRGEKEGRVSFWLQPRAYDCAPFRDAWDRIGRGDQQGTPKKAKL